MHPIVQNVIITPFLDTYFFSCKKWKGFFPTVPGKDTNTGGIKLNCKVAMMAGNAKEKTIGAFLFGGALKTN